MSSRIARIWNGTDWEIISPQVVSPSIVASYQPIEPTSPVTGQLWIDSDEDIEVFDTQIITRWSKTLSTTESSFSGLSDGVLLEYTPGYEQVYLNGILLLRGIDYTATNGTSISLSTAANSGDVVEILCPNNFTTVNAYTVSEVDYFLSLKANSTDLTLKADIASPVFTGIPTAPTAIAGTNTTQVATTAFVRTEVANVVDAAPSTLDTLNELAAALGDDPNFATTVTNSIASKQKLIPLQNTAPTSPSNGDLWVDNTDPAKPVLKVYNGSSWITAGSSITADDDQIILASRVFT